jgi:hypothetical protein
MKFSFLQLGAIVLVGLSACSPSQKLNKTDAQALAGLRAHVQYLADDKLEGRRTGTKGELAAAEYITTQFKSIGLKPKGDILADGPQVYDQAFEVNEGKQIDTATHLYINGTELTIGSDYFPFAFSANGAGESAPSIAVKEQGVPWFIDLKDALEDNKTNPHFDLLDYIHTYGGKLSQRGAATALVLFNSSSDADGLKFSAKDKSSALKLPVIYITQSAAKKYLADPSATIQFKFSVSLSDKVRTGHNVVGYIDNGAATTVVLGAHFDHLGYGEDGNSRYEKKEPAIHNGADDNASGTATLIELARKLKKSKQATNNYLFIAFSGEELGLYGSKHFTESPSIDLSKVSYMINMDMVGRLNDSTKTVTIGGYGTSPEWATVITPNAKANGYFTTKIDSSGSGPSDHTSFYKKDIPVLFYFTGLHTDYHKPSDDADRINYEGMSYILKDVVRVIGAMNGKGKLAFLKTREAQTTTSARFSVSLGVMPDYTYSGNGLRVDGVIDGRAAQKAGLKAGDIVLQIGDYKISSMDAYMQALSKFKKGDKTKVVYQRGKETITTDVQF